MNKKLKGNLILLFTAIIWGSGFVCQSIGMDHIGANTFMGLRTLLGALVLLPVIFVTDKAQNKQGKKENDRSTLLKGGLICGTILCLASTTQTIGIKYTTAANSGFITAMYIIFVPFLGLFFKKKIGIRTCIGALLAVAGLYMLSVAGTSFKINKGDLLTLLCALFFAFHIITVDYFSPKTDGVKLSCIQFFVCAALNLILMLIFEKPSVDIIKECWVAIVYSGIVSCGIGYTCQILGQKYTDPAPAAIIMSMESVFAAIGGFLILHESLGFVKIIGCVIMFAAIVIVQLPQKNKKL